MRFLVILLWIWLFISVGVYLFRLVRWIGRKGEPSPPPVTSTKHDAPSGSSPLPPLIVDGQSLEPGVAAALAEQRQLDADTPSSARSRDDEPSISRGPRPTLAEAVKGIEMPCDLAPLLHADGAVDPFRATFATTGPSPIVVAGGLSAELERLGYSMTQTGMQAYVAVRDGNRVEVAIHADPSAFPTAPPGSVVVELRT